MPEWWESTGRAADLEAELLDRRLVLLSGYLNGVVANRAAASVMLLEARSTQPIEIRISCPDVTIQMLHVVLV